MNIDIVTSDHPEDRDKMVRYGEPMPKAVYEAAFGIEPGASADLCIIKNIVEQADDLHWEIFSLEFGCEEQPASFWQCSDYISNLSPHELHIEYERGIEYVKNEYYRATVYQMDVQ